MSWTPPQLPLSNRDTIVTYWQGILEIPLSEPGAEILRSMAFDRLAELHAKPARHAERSLPARRAPL